MVYHAPSLDSTFSALAHPVRRELITRLSTGAKTIGELAARYDMTLPAVSKHLRILERAGLATIRREGRVRRTRLVARPMLHAVEWMEQYRRFWDFQFDQLAAYLAQNSNTETTQWASRPEQPRGRSKSAGHSRPRASASSMRGRARKR